MKVLFIDDDDMRTREYREGLEVLGGYKVDYEPTPHAAVDRFRTEGKEYSAVIADIMLPHYGIPRYKDFSIPGYFDTNEDGMYTGLKVLLELSGIIDEQKLRVVLIVLSCVKDIEKCLKEIGLRVDLIVFKPILLPELLERMKRVVG